jgi:hypothetical protein
LSHLMEVMWRPRLLGTVIGKTAES